MPALLLAFSLFLLTLIPLPLAAAADDPGVAPAAAPSEVPPAAAPGSLPAAAPGSLPFAVPSTSPAATPGTAPAAAPGASPAETAAPGKPGREGQGHRGKDPAPVNKLDAVEVTVPHLNDTDQRRYATAAKMVFGREELDHYGDTSVGEVLKRLPGVTIAGTPGRGGDIRMRGLGNGYTMILLNGEPMPRGFSLDQLAPEQVERIEIMRAPVAEHSTRAIAGIINIVLREDFVRHSNEARPVLGYEGGRAQPQVYLQHSDGDKQLQYSFGANLAHRELPSDTSTTTFASNSQTGAPILAQSQRDQSLSTSDSLHLNGRVNWRLGGGDSLSLQPFLLESHSVSDTRSTLDQSVGSAPAPFARAQAHGDSHTAVARLMGNYRLGLGEGSKLELRFNLGDSNSSSQTTRNESDLAGNPSHQILNRADIDDRSAMTAGKYSRPIGTSQQFSAGWEIEEGHRAETTDTFQDGVNPLAAYGDQIRARTLRLAGFAQDDWDLNPLWSMYGGLRWEESRTQASALTVAADNTSVVLNPLLHSVWRFSSESKDLIRAALTGSYRAPTLGNLAPVPTLSALYPATVANTAASPDAVGNPNLRPELARGLDLAFEHYLAHGGLFSVSGFQRDISDLIRTVVNLQTVPWSSLPRWVSQPQNFSHAVTRGIELEAKFQPAELFAGGSRDLDLRANYSRFWSQVDGIPGPDNRLDQQPTQTGNLGADYHWAGTPLSIGGNLNWTPGFLVRTNVNQTYQQGSKRALDLYGLWRFNPAAQLRLTLSNALHYDYLTGDGQTYGPNQQQAETVTRTYPSLSARLELRF